MMFGSWHGSSLFSLMTRLSLLVHVHLSVSCYISVHFIFRECGVTLPRSSLIGVDLISLVHLSLLTYALQLRVVEFSVSATGKGLRNGVRSGVCGLEVALITASGMSWIPGGQEEVVTGVTLVIVGGRVGLAAEEKRIIVREHETSVKNMNAC